LRLQRGQLGILAADWINPIISGLAAVLGAAVGAGAAIYVGRESRSAQARADLARAFSAYLAAVETLVSEYRRRPWRPTHPRLKRLREGGFIAQFLYAPLFWLDVAFLRSVEGDRAFQVRDRYRRVTADLRVVADPPLVQLVNEVDDMFRPWQERPNTPEWPPLRDRMLSVYRLSIELPDAGAPTRQD